MFTEARDPWMPFISREAERMFFGTFCRIPRSARGPTDVAKPSNAASQALNRVPGLSVYDHVLALQSADSVIEQAFVRHRRKELERLNDGFGHATGELYSRAQTSSFVIIRSLRLP